MMHTCLNCKKTENDIPLVVLQYQGEQVFLCSQCLPILLHAPAKLKDTLANSEKIQPARHEKG